MTDSSRLTVGVDPGATGAIAAVIGTDWLAWAVDMPLVGKDIAVALLDQLYDADQYGPYHLHPGVVIGIEHVHSMPGQGVSSTFGFGKAYGLVLGFFAGRGHRIEHVSPSKWKADARLTRQDKDAARLRVIEMCPQQAAMFGRKKDVGRADAVLIAMHTARLAHRHQEAA